MSEYLVSTICASYCYNDVVCINCGMLRIIHVFVSCSQYRLVKDLVSTIYVCVDNADTDLLIDLAHILQC